MLSGVTAKIPKGTVITGTFPGPPKVAGRTYTVRVLHIHSGYVPTSQYDLVKDIFSVGSITWAGASGYWHEAAIEDVEITGTTVTGNVTRADIEAAKAALA